MEEVSERKESPRLPLREMRPDLNVRVGTEPAGEETRTRAEPKFNPRAARGSGMGRQASGALVLRLLLPVALPGVVRPADVHPQH